MSLNVNQAGGAGAVNGLNFGTDSNVQLVFAQLQMELAKTNKEAALDKIEDIRVQQRDSAAYTETINAMRTLSGYDVEKYGEIPTDPKALQAEIDACQAAYDDVKATYEEKKNDTAHTHKLSTATHEYWNNNQYVKGLKGYEDLQRGSDNKHYPYELKGGMDALSERLTALKAMQTVISTQTTDKVSVIDDCGITLKSNFSSDDVKEWISSLEASQEELGTDIQQQMVFVQDYMGQYNSYTQGASSAVSDSSETLKTVARG